MNRPKPKRAIAIDFDGTLFTEMWPGVGEPIWPVINAAKAEKASGSELILWTLREGETLELALEACASVGLFFDAINESCEDWKAYYGNNPRKVGATEYWDDRSVHPEYFIQSAKIRKTGSM